MDPGSQLKFNESQRGWAVCEISFSCINRNILCAIENPYEKHTQQQPQILQLAAEFGIFTAKYVMAEEGP